MKILLTGFDPFGGENVNPSWLAVCAAAEKIGFADVKTLLLPTEYYASVNKVTDAINEFRPDAVVSVGQAGGRASVSFEHVAVNIIDSDTPDNAGVSLHSLNCTDGPDKFESTLPINEMVKAVNEAGLPAYISASAGRFVCNHVFYGVSKYVSDNSLPIKVGFIHVPFIPKQTVSRPNTASMSLENITESLVCALSVLVK